MERVLKAVLPNGRSELYRLPEPVDFNPVGYRVLVPLRDGRGATAVVVRQFLADPEGLPYIDSFPDRFPVINPLAIEVLKNNLLEYLTTLGEAIFKLLPPWADWYQETFVYLERFSPVGLPKEVVKLAEELKKKGRLEYEKLKRSYDWRLIKFLEEKGFLKVETRWVAPKVEEYFLVAATTDEEEVLKKISRAGKRRKEETLRVIRLFSELGRELTAEEIKELADVSSQTLRYLLDKGILVKRTYTMPPFRAGVLKQSGRPAAEPPPRALFKNPTFSERLERLLPYLEHTLREGGDTLLLAPTLALAEEYHRALYPLFGDRVLLYAESLPQRERIKNWFAAAEGFPKIFITTPKNLFAPLKNLKLLVLEDESGNYKLERSPYFNLKRLAFELVKLSGGKLIVFGEPPSVELHLAESSFKVFEREKTLRVYLYDGKNPFGDETVLELLRGFSDRKTLLLVPKAGYSNLMCPRCGTLEECPRCEVFLRLEGKRAVCPVCGYSTEGLSCSRCGEALKPFGYGVDRVEELLKRQIPEGHFEFKTTLNEPINAVYEAVFVLFADRILSLPDFRKTEELFIYLTKAKLSLKEGGFLFVHTSGESHAAASLTEGEKLFYETELEMRKALKLPPFAKLYLVALTLKEENEKLALRVFKEVKTALAGLPVEVGFSKAPTFKLRERYRFQILIKTPPRLERTELKKLSGFLKELKNRYRFVRVIPNPRSFL